MHKLRLIVGGVTLVLSVLAAAQETLAPKAATVLMSPPPLVSIMRGSAGTVPLHFRVIRGFHINSNTPTSEFLIPTTLKLDAPTDIVVGRITYPVGQDMNFPFAPDEKLNVYSGDFELSVVVRPLHYVVAGKYMFRGELKYQACDKAQCYPPRQIPVKFEVKVAKDVPPPKKNPAQSPHVHR